MLFCDRSRFFLLYRFDFQPIADFNAKLGTRIVLVELIDADSVALGDVVWRIAFSDKVIAVILGQFFFLLDTDFDVLVRMDLVGQLRIVNRRALRRRG